ncbi:head GIN domain-containing protein [Mucilaginibacter sp.]|uniref:head GIN domain-containing protein n=1 Tax=Mucilaginibacter sp. TaxID=1882438 RepID=UPI0025EF38A3|nr:head GIN domain-containing protein [Mucilaginibacter sp.]
MKKLIFSGMALLLTVSMAFNSSAQTVTRNVSGYTGVSCGGPFNVFIKIDGTESIKLDVDANVVNDIKTEVENGVLKVEFKDHWRNHRNIQRANIYITAKTLAYLGNSGSGNTTVDGVMSAQNARVALSGSGNIKTAVKSSTLDLSLSGSGSIDIKGSAGTADIHIAGSGEVNGKDLKTQTVEARISGSGSVNIIADKTVSASIAGSGSVQYSGNATTGTTHYAGSGRVNKVD